MAINKKLIYFKKKRDFDTQKEANNILDSSIVFIDDSVTISTHGADYNFINWSILEPVPEGYSVFNTSSNNTFIASDGNFYVKTD